MSANHRYVRMMLLPVLIVAAVMAGGARSFSPSVYDYYDFVEIPRTQTLATDNMGVLIAGQQAPREIRNSDHQMTGAEAIESRLFRRPPPPPPQQIRPQYRQPYKPKNKEQPAGYRQGSAGYRERPVFRQQSQGERPPLSRNRPQQPYKQSPPVPSRHREQRPYVEEAFDEYPVFEDRPEYHERPQFLPRPQFQGRPEFDDDPVYEEEIRQLPLQYDDSPQYKDSPQYQDAFQYNDEPQYEDHPQFKDGPQYPDTPQYDEHLAYEDEEHYVVSPQYDETSKQPILEQASSRPEYQEDVSPKRPQYDTPKRPQYDTPKRPQYEAPKRPQYHNTPKRPQYQDRPAPKKRPTYEVEDSKDIPKVVPGAFLPREEERRGSEVAESVKEKRQAVHYDGPHTHLDAAGKEFVEDAREVEQGQTDGRLSFQIHGQEGPHSYRFGYDTGKGYNRQFRYEERDGKGEVHGRYGFYDTDGKLKVVNYSAHPKHGFSADVPH